MSVCECVCVLPTPSSLSPRLQTGVIFSLPAHTHIPASLHPSSGPQVSFWSLLLSSDPKLLYGASCPICLHHITAESASRNKVSHVTGLPRTPQDWVPGQYSVALHPKSCKICLQICPSTPSPYNSSHQPYLKPTFIEHLLKPGPAPGRACWSWDRSQEAHGPRALCPPDSCLGWALFPFCLSCPLKSFSFF